MLKQYQNAESRCMVETLSCTKWSCETLLLCALEMKWLVPVAIYQGGWQPGALWCQYMYLETCIAGSIYCDVVTPVLPDILHTASVSIDTNRMGLVGPQITCTHTLLTFLHAMKFKWVPPSFAMGLYPFWSYIYMGPQIYTSVRYLFVKMPWSQKK